MRLSTAAFVLTLVASTAVDAHVTLWHPSLFGYTSPPTNDKTQAWLRTLANPLRGMENLTVEQWFGHGVTAFPPEPGQFLELPTGESVTFELACNRGYTSWSGNKQLPYYACDKDKGPLHNGNTFTTNPLNVSLFGGTALAIAYTSDVTTLKPEDMTIISVNRTSPWVRETVYQIPAGLPPCPDGGCLVTWNWLHLKNNGEGYGSEIYNTLYRAKITGKTNKKNSVGPGNVPVKCDGAPQKCVKGPKQPMYLWQKTGNNMAADTTPGAENPHYSEAYGFADGAQDEAILVNFRSGAGRTAPAGSVAAVVVAAVLGLLV